MTPRRRQLREMEVMDELITYQKAVIPCFRCRVAFTSEDVKTGNIENEHLHEHALGGSDEPHNRRFSHKRGCHEAVTNGTPATSAGSSKNRIAKATHQSRIEKFIVNKRPIALQALVDPGAKCRGCGQYQDACKCKPKEGTKSKWPASTRSN